MHIIRILYEKKNIKKNKTLPLRENIHEATTTVALAITKIAESMYNTGHIPWGISNHSQDPESGIWESVVVAVEVGRETDTQGCTVKRLL